MPPSARYIRTKAPRWLAVIDADRCTGCGACIEVCPTEAIARVRFAQAETGVPLPIWCEVDWDRCIGCKLCVRLPGKKADPYTLLLCPWGAIEMLAPGDLAAAVDRMGGPSEYVAAHRNRLLAAAQRQSGPNQESSSWKPHATTVDRAS